MSDEAGLLRAIHTDPDDDLPRLAYADWLDEHGLPERAEFIRVQIELERMREEIDEERPGYPDGGRLSSHELKLRTVQVEQLLTGFDPEERKRIDVWFERGFPGSLAVREGLHTDYRILRSLPGLREVCILDGNVTVEVVNELGGLEHLDELRIYRTPFHADWLDLLALLPPWTSVSIDGDGAEFDRAWRAFQNRRIAGLTRAPRQRLRQTVRRLLDISSDFPQYHKSPRRGGPILRGRLSRTEDFDLALLSHVSELEEVKLGLRNETEEGLRHLACLPNLRSLQLHLSQAGTIAPLTACAGLERLHVSVQGILMTDDGTEGLDRLTNLRELHLNGGTGSLRDGTLRRLAPLTQLRSLEINFGELEEDSLSVLAGLTKLEMLTLAGPTQDHELRHLAGLTDLTFLSLHGSSVTDAALAQLTRLTKLHTLEVRAGQPQITEAGARRLAAQLPEVTIILDNVVVKSPRAEFVFRRRLVAGFVSGLFPIHWPDCPDRKDETDDCICLDEDGWEHVSRQEDDRPAVIGLLAFGHAGGQSATQAMDRHVNHERRDNPRVLDRSVVSLAGQDTASCVFVDGDSQQLICEIIDQNRWIALTCTVAADRFEEFRRLFLFIARSMRVGEEAERDVGEVVTVATSEL